MRTSRPEVVAERVLVPAGTRCGEAIAVWALCGQRLNYSGVSETVISAGESADSCLYRPASSGGPGNL